MLAYLLASTPCSEVTDKEYFILMVLTLATLKKLNQKRAVMIWVREFKTSAYLKDTVNRCFLSIIAILF